jgi:hypothetical protein
MNSKGHKGKTPKAWELIGENVHLIPALANRFPDSSYMSNVCPHKKTKSGDRAAIGSNYCRKCWHFCGYRKQERCIICSYPDIIQNIQYHE